MRNIHTFGSLWFILLLFAEPAAAQAPAVSGMLNSGDYTAEIAPGTIVSIFGDNLAVNVTQAATAPLPTTLEATSVELTSQGQTYLLPLFFVSARQINAQVPYGLSGAVQFRVKTAKGTSSFANATIQRCAPRLFTWTKDGKGDAVVIHANYTPINTASPARAGEIVIVYLTGLGAVSPSLAAGSAAGDGSAAAPINYVVEEPQVRVGGQPAKVWFSGLAPYFAGLYQLNVQMPDTLLPGSNTISIRTATSKSQESVTIPISSSWTAEKSATLGPSGGTLTGSTAALSLNAGALTAVRELTIFRNAAPPPSANDKYRASDVIAVSGVPDSFAAPITVSLNVTRQTPAKGQAFVVLQTNGSGGDGRLFLDATIDGGKATVTIPAGTLATSNSATKQNLASSAAAGEVKSAWTMWAIAGYYAYKSSGNHFRVIFPAEDLVEGGAEQMADALEVAHKKIGDLGIDWGRRNGIGSWPIDVSIEYFDGDRKDRWGEEGSIKPWGVQRQGLNLNASFLTKRENLDTMRVTAGHELFHLAQNLYDLEWAPSTWLWMEEAISTWFERRMSSDPNFIPGTVTPVNGTANYRFMLKHGLEYAPGTPDAVQDHGYGASLFLESITRRKGDTAIAQLVQKMAIRAQGITARPLYSPVEAINSITGDVGVEWHQFCESFIAGKAYGDKPAFPTPAQLVTIDTLYAWKGAADPGFTWQLAYPDLTARVAYIDLKDAGWPSSTKLSITLDGGGASAAAIVYRYSPNGDYTRVGLVRDGVLEIANAETMVAQNQKLIIMVVNSRAVAPYTGRTPLTLKLRTGASLLDWLHKTKGFFYTARITLCFADANGRETCPGNDFTIANDWLGVWSKTEPQLTWSGTHFSAKGKVPTMHDIMCTNCDFDVEGDVDATGTNLVRARMKVKQYSDGKIYEDWDVEIFNFPLTSSSGPALANCQSCSLNYEPYNPPDWSQKIKINKFSRYSTLSGAETRRFLRIQAVKSSWAIFGRP